MDNIVLKESCCFVDTVIYDDNGSIWGIAIIVGEVYSPTYELRICKYRDIKLYDNYKYKNFNYYDETGTCSISNYRELIVPFSVLENYKFPKTYKIKANKLTRFLYALIISNAKYGSYIGLSFDNLIFSQKTFRAELKSKDGSQVDILDQQGNLADFKFVISKRNKKFFSEFDNLEFEDYSKSGYIEASTKNLELSTLGFDDTVLITDKELGTSFLSIPFPIINYYVRKEYQNTVRIKYLSIYNNMRIDLNRFESTEMMLGTEDLSHYNWSSYPSLVVNYKQLDLEKSKRILIETNKLYNILKQNNINLSLLDYRNILSNYFSDTSIRLEDYINKQLNNSLEHSAIENDRKIRIELTEAIKSVLDSNQYGFTKSASSLIKEICLVQRDIALAGLMVNNTRRELISKSFIEYYTKNYKFTKVKLILYV